ncbi:hypothetical protein ACRYCC_27610 [Actinomadura scrupuli]|uniref:hypothetical protein n=1 Tax=Actinomadura scrupuli TaxID=559629 RepID=UPI003D9833B6
MGHLAEALSRVIAYNWLLSLGRNPLGVALAAPSPSPSASALYDAAAVLAIFCLAVLLLPDIRRLGLPQVTQRLVGPTVVVHS